MTIEGPVTNSIWQDEILCSDDCCRVTYLYLFKSSKRTAYHFIAGHAAIHTHARTASNLLWFLLIGYNCNQKQEIDQLMSLNWANSRRVADRYVKTKRTCDCAFGNGARVTLICPLLVPLNYYIRLHLFWEGHFGWWCVSARQIADKKGRFGLDPSGANPSTVPVVI